MTYAFDPELRERTTDRLYALLPELYRLRDFPDPKSEPKKSKQTAPGLEELYRFLHVVAAPLAEVRQSIEELHANLFVDTAADWALPYLAKLIDLTLIFPEARANRRDLRSAVAFRRRKGTVSTLERLGNELSERIVASQEGFKLVLVSQDLDFLRHAHAIPSLVSPLIAEAASGPLDRQSHVVDIRPPTAGSGRYHPRQITHWMHATALFPLREGYPRSLPPAATPNPAFADRRFAFHPKGTMVPLRVRKAGPDDPLRTDLVRAEHFRASPGRYFDQTGVSSARFSVRISGLPAATAEPEAVSRLATTTPAHESLVRTVTAISLLDVERKHRNDAITVSVVAAPLLGLMPQVAGSQVRGTLAIAESGSPVPGPAGSNTTLVSPFVALLRVARSTGTGTAFFAGGTFLLTGEDVEAKRTSAVTDLAREGYLRGALFVHLPPLRIQDAGGPSGGRWFYLAADGSLIDAQTPAAATAGTGPNVALQNATTLPAEVVEVGPHPAWPPLTPTHLQSPLVATPPAPWRSPVIAHGGGVLQRLGPSTVVVPVPPSPKALTFAIFHRGVFTPFIRVVWSDNDPTAATSFEVIRASGVAATEALAAAAMGVFLDPQLGDPAVWHALLAENDAEIVVRFESLVAGLILPPSEVVLTSATGTTTLVHLPELETAPSTVPWQASLASTSPIVRIQADGSTAWFGTYDLARRSYGPIAPLREPSALARRRLRQRTLCGWSKETAATFMPATPSGHLDVDPEHGLFSLADADTLVAYPALVGAVSTPAVVTVDAQEGYSQHVGVRPAFRQPLLGQELAAPTRIVAGTGRYHDGARGALGRLPRHKTLQEAFAAIQAMGAHESEVVQIEDSATYDEQLVWPLAVQRLVVQAAESERPIIRLGADVAAGAATYKLLRLAGVALSGKNVTLPLCDAVELDFVSFLEGDRILSLPTAAGHVSHVAIRFCILGRLVAFGRDVITIADTVIDAHGGAAVAANLANVSLERVTVVANSLPAPPPGEQPWSLEVLILSASETIFAQHVRALDRFHGCIRYSRVEPGSETPRRHRVVEEIPRFVSLDRDHAAHLRLSERCPRSIVGGAEDGSEMGAFQRTRLAQYTAAVRSRLVEFTPAGMRTGLVRMD